jgi:hypothetical protein
MAYVMLTLNFEGIAALVPPSPLPVSYILGGNVLSFVATNITCDFSVSGGPPGQTPVELDVVLLRI